MKGRILVGLAVCLLVGSLLACSSPAEKVEETVEVEQQQSVVVEETNIGAVENNSTIVVPEIVENNGTEYRSRVK